MAAVVEGVDLDAYDRRVVADYSLPDGRLKIIPAQRKKLEAALRYVVKVFEPGVRYSMFKIALAAVPGGESN